MSMRLETARLVIRTFEPRDAQPWITMVNDPAVKRYTPPAPTATAEVFDKVLEWRQALERDRTFSLWAVDDKETSSFVGQCGLQPVERKGPEIELGYHFSPAVWGKGFATEAAVAVLRYAFDNALLDHVIAIVIPENVASVRVVEKAGMRFDGIATYYQIEGLKKYAADRATWRPPNGSG